MKGKILKIFIAFILIVINALQATAVPGQASYENNNSSLANQLVSSEFPETGDYFHKHQYDELVDPIPPTEESLFLTQHQVQAFSCATVTDVPQIECEALLALYNTTNGSNWYHKRNWLETTTVGNWLGVTVKDGHVTGIKFINNNLVGTLPNQLGNLTYLEKMIFANYYYQISGSFPTFISRLTNLKILSLVYLQLTGSLPTDWSNLTKLEYLILQDLKLSGEIPSSLGNLTNLKGLILDRNQLTGTIPSELGNLVNLTHLSLMGNKLTGNIPLSLTQNPDLKTLNLSDNLLSGSIPKEIGNMSGLRTLDLSRNNFTGTIPIELANLSSLRTYNRNEKIHAAFIHLTDNQLTGQIPQELGDLLELKSLSLGENNLDGNIPGSLGSLTKLQGLNLGRNELNGSLPDVLGNLSDLQALDLSGNYLSGEIPIDIVNLTKLYDPNPYITFTNQPTDIACNFFSVPQPNNAVQDFLNTKDPDWAEYQGVTPLAENDDYTFELYLGIINVPAAGVLENDFKINQLPLSLVAMERTAYGDLSLYNNGAFRYSPYDLTARTYTDTFIYKFREGHLESNAATATMTVTILNSPPVANDDFYALEPNEVLRVSAPGVLRNDYDLNKDPLSMEILTDVSHGILQADNDGGFTYTPETDFEGRDSFTYKVSDGELFSNIATVNIHVVPMPNKQYLPIVSQQTSTLHIENAEPLLFDLGQAVGLISIDIENQVPDAEPDHECAISINWCNDTGRIWLFDLCLVDQAEFRSKYDEIGDWIIEMFYFGGRGSYTTANMYYYTEPPLYPYCGKR